MRSYLSPSLILFLILCFPSCESVTDSPVVHNMEEFEKRPSTVKPGVIQRKSTTKEAVFAMAIEAHGSYDPVSKLSSGAYGRLSNLEVVSSNEDYVGLIITTKKKGI
ncbi:hypothetical protein AAU57_08270 [Nonlabens sp. YIK11]|uniref:hypothetical protein n=1 Tax=Nonlabens sp. YIK11 TaxID=1453349 RepID=UPI0006DCBD05|nr:hypothetical protein [Nonlabens sp. YIK11]KQC33311.1 hypothetical protein AAU57_08270 [Nonlabens sp. YIK11]